MGGAMAELAPLACTACGVPVVVVEMVTGYLDWGRAVVCQDGVVRPVGPVDPPVVMADSSATTGVYAQCEDRRCDHRWKLRRRFDPLLAKGATP